MPKLKTHRGAAKRFKVTGTGKIVRASAFRRHILTSKTTQSKRHKRGSVEVHSGDAPKLKLMLELVPELMLEQKLMLKPMLKLVLMLK